MSAVAELAGGAALILGVIPRYVALLLIPLISGTIVAVDGKNGWMFSKRGRKVGMSSVLGIDARYRVSFRRRCVGVARVTGTGDDRRFDC